MFGTRSLVFLCVLLPTLALTGELTTAEPIEDGTDERLTKTYSFFFPPTPLSDLLQAISRQTGVSLRTERWVAPHRAILVTHEKPLQETLNKLAEAFGYTWRKVKRKDALPEYVLYEPAQAMSQQQAEVKNLRQTYLRLLREAVSGWSQYPITDLRKAREEVLTAVQQLHAKGQKGRNPALAQRAIRTAMQAELTETWATWTLAVMLARLAPQQWNALERGEVFLMDTRRTDAPLPPDVLELFRWEGEADIKQQQKVFPEAEGEQFRQEQVRRYRTADSATICFALHPVSGRLYYDTAVLTGNEMVIYGGRAATSPLWEIAKALQDLASDAESPPPYDEELVKRLSAKTPRPVSLELSAAMDVTGNILALYARENRVDLVAEWYPYLPREGGDAGESRTETFRVVGMGEGIRIQAPSRDLEAGEVAFGGVKILAHALDWRTVQSSLRENRYLLRDSEGWAVVTQQLRSLCRQCEIPETSIRKWFLKPREQGMPDVGDLLEIAELQPEQIERLERKRQNLPDASKQFIALNSLASNPATQAVFLALGSVSPAQRQSMWNGAAIPIPLLSPPAQRYLLFAVRWAAPRGIVGSPERSSFAVRLEETVREEPDMARFSEELLRSLRNDSPEEWLRRQPEDVRRQLTRTQVIRSLHFILATPEEEIRLISLSLTR